MFNFSIQDFMFHYDKLSNEIRIYKVIQGRLKLYDRFYASGSSLPTKKEEFNDWCTKWYQKESEA